MSKTSIHDLADLLRDHSRWPAGFVWDYCSPCNCALGLSRLMHGLKYFHVAYRFYGLTEELADRVFIRACQDKSGATLMSMSEVTPERVADLIDQLIPRTKSVTPIEIFQAMLTPSPVTVDAMKIADHAREIVR